MGLDISYYEHVTLVEAISAEELRKRDWEHPLYDDSKHLFLYNPHFPERSDGMREGFYATSDRRSFRAGSYSGYSAYRALLAQLVGTTDAAIWAKKKKTGPFVEQIDFSDCEGFIGPKTSAKLAGDYREHLPRAEALLDSWDFELYRQWMLAFETAARGGVVEFH